jgi:hypothetical protein
MRQRLHQQALRIDQNIPLPAFDLFAAVNAWWINPRAPFSVLSTLWLSTMTAVELASPMVDSRQKT